MDHSSDNENCDDQDQQSTPSQDMERVQRRSPRHVRHPRQPINFSPGTAQYRGTPRPDYNPYLPPRYSDSDSTPRDGFSSSTVIDQTLQSQSTTWSPFPGHPAYCVSPSAVPNPMLCIPLATSSPDPFSPMPPTPFYRPVRPMGNRPPHVRRVLQYSSSPDSSDPPRPIRPINRNIPSSAPISLPPNPNVKRVLQFDCDSSSPDSSKTPDYNDTDSPQFDLDGSCPDSSTPSNYDDTGAMQFDFDSSSPDSSPPLKPPRSISRNAPRAAPSPYNMPPNQIQPVHRDTPMFGSRAQTPWNQVRPFNRDPRSTVSNQYTPANRIRPFNRSRPTEQPTTLGQRLPNYTWRNLPGQRTRPAYGSHVPRPRPRLPNSPPNSSNQSGTRQTLFQSDESQTYDTTPTFRPLPSPWFRRRPNVNDRSSRSRSPSPGRNANQKALVPTGLHRPLQNPAELRLQIGYRLLRRIISGKTNQAEMDRDWQLLHAIFYQEVAEALAEGTFALDMITPVIIMILAWQYSQMKRGK